MVCFLASGVEDQNGRVSDGDFFVLLKDECDGLVLCKFRVFKPNQV
jgi:hypothetical protein